MTEHIREWHWIPEGEPVFQTKVYEEKISDELLIAMLAFPAMRI